MNRHPSFRASLPLVFALAAVGACGSAAEWKPPPIAAIPVAPWPGEKSASAAAFDEVATSAPAPSAAPSAAKSAPAPSPMSGELPMDLEGKLAAHATCKQKECPQPALYPASSAIDAKAPVAVWSHEIAQGDAVSFPRDGEVDVYGIVLRGPATVTGVEGGKGTSLKAWGAFHAPGGGVTVSASGNARVVFAVVTSGEPVGDAAANAKKEGAKLAWKDRPSPIETADLAGAQDLAWAGGAVHARIAFEGEKARASLGVLLAAKDAPVAQHQHDTSWEILAALRADGTVKRADAAKPTELAPTAVKDGAIVAIPKATQHAWVAGGTRPLVAIQIYAPPGPEQRFKKLAADAK